MDVSITGQDTICINFTTTVAPTSGGTWTSINPNIATVTNNGVVTGLSSGTAMLYFTSNTTGCSSENINITVRENVDLTISGPNEIGIGETTTVVSGTSGTWLSSGPAIASVDNNGIVTGN